MDLDGLYIGRNDGGGSAYLFDTIDEPLELITNNGNGVVTIHDNGSVNAGQYTAASGYISAVYPSTDRHEFEYADLGAGLGDGSWYSEDEPTINAPFGIFSRDGTGLWVTPVLGRNDPWSPSIDVLAGGGTDSMVQSIYTGGSCFLCVAGETPSCGANDPMTLRRPPITWKISTP